ncbi:YeeE/YedE family protein [Terasakiella sp. A23]|uniref:YeeE/YedE family protein n=1 Tax=Terasakiella sp. FCG-A23 TaxID=3080561 RepID=UPI002955CBBA|nr:YeeE/YedE family protein [Terasakiella sp. A23]MDV7338192.1 YeeE/YedE family protein [Terasakiella sp. A23]
MEQLVDAVGGAQATAIGGIVIGIVFGYFGQRSRFCLRAAAIEFSRGALGEKLAIWFIVFSTAVIGTQSLILMDEMSVDEARQLALPGSLSGALIGGLLFGSGMILARGCSSRMLVLSANGNLRSLLTGLVFAVVAQASLRGILSPARTEIASIWLISPEDLSLFGHLGVGPAFGILVGCLCLGGALWIARKHTIAHKVWLGAVVVGATVPAAWYLTFSVAGLAFEPIQVEALSFSGPSADTLMLVMNQPVPEMDFDVGLIPGVFLGSFLAAYFARELKLEGFDGAHSMKRYILGAAFMGFGGMLAGGCAVGAGVTGGSIFTVTAWTTLFMMWIGAGITDLVVDRKKMVLQSL